MRIKTTLPLFIFLSLISSVNICCTSLSKQQDASETMLTDSADLGSESESATTEEITTPNENKGFIPNELGRVMVLEYHLIGTTEGRWTRTPQNLQKDLQLLYDQGFYPIKALDLAHGTFKVPAGKTPFVLTFDDSSAGQFRFIVKNGKPEIDPECAVGILEGFKKKHPDFPLTATFYVLPAIKPALRLFGQPEYQKEKLEWLLKNGYEIGNHGWYHVPLNKLDDEGVQKHLAMFVKEIKAFIPDYEVKSLALPLGMRAKNLKLESEGKFEDVKYKHEAVFLVGSATSVSPYSKAFNRLAIERVQAGDGILGPAFFIEQQNKNGSRFISDGDPSKITAPEKYKDKLNTELSSKYKIVWVTE